MEGGHSNPNNNSSHSKDSTSKSPPRMGNQPFKHNRLEAQEADWATGQILQWYQNTHPIWIKSEQIGQVCHKLNHWEVEEQRSDINRVLNNSYLPKPNITKAEYKPMQQIKVDKNRIIFAADKGTVMVVTDKQEYIQKDKNSLEQPTCRLILWDPTNKYKAKLITILQRIKLESGMEDSMYKRMYPTGAHFPKFCSLPKIYKKDIP